MRLPLLLAFCGVVLLPAGATTQEPAAPYPRLPWARAYFPLYDDAAAAAGLPLLRAQPLPAGEREVRIWTQVDVALPRGLYRFRELPGPPRRVWGERILYWPLRSGVRRTGITDVAEIRRRHTVACDSITGRGGTLVCRTRFTAPPDWAAVLRQAEQAGLRGLPDASTLPADGVVLSDEGWIVTVELRDGPWYRTYHYESPEEHPRWPSAVRASAILRTLHAVDLRAVRPALP